MPERGSAWFRLHAQIDRARLSSPISPSLSLSKNTRIYICIDTVSARLSLVLLWIFICKVSKVLIEILCTNKWEWVGIITRLSDALHRKDVKEEINVILFQCQSNIL